MPKEMNQQHKDAPPNTSLSNSDKAFMVINYLHPNPDSRNPEWTLSRALNVVGVTGRYFLKMTKARSLTDVRTQFWLWNADQQQLRVGGRTQFS